MFLNPSVDRYLNIHYVGIIAHSKYLFLGIGVCFQTLLKASKYKRAYREILSRWRTTLYRHGRSVIQSAETCAPNVHLCLHCAIADRGIRRTARREMGGLASTSTVLILVTLCSSWTGLAREARIIILNSQEHQHQYTRPIGKNTFLDFDCSGAVKD